MPSSIISSHHLQELASAFYLTDQCFFGFHQNQHKNNEVIEASLPPSNQFSVDNFSEKLSELDTLESLVLSSNHNRKFPRKISSIPTPSESSQNTKVSSCVTLHYIIYVIITSIDYFLFWILTCVYNLFFFLHHYRIWAFFLQKKSSLVGWFLILIDTFCRIKKELRGLRICMNILSSVLIALEVLRVSKLIWSIIYIGSS